MVAVVAVVGGSGTSGEEYSNIEVIEKYNLFIYNNKITKYKFNNNSNPIRFVNITGNVNAGEINAQVEVLKNTSSHVKTPSPGFVYKNVNIWIGTSGFSTQKNIKQAIIKFRIENSWLENNSFEASDVKLARWDGNKWRTLNTTENTKDGSHTFFEANTDGFSAFAITGSEKKGAIPEKASILNPIDPNTTIQPTIPSEGKTFSFLIDWVLIIGVFFVIGVIIEIHLKMKNK